LSATAAEFSWDAPAGCPERDALRWRIEEALGTKLEQAATLRFTAKVEQKSSKRWAVALDVANDSSSSEPQHRQFEAPSCDELAQAVTVAIALALGADVTAEKGRASESDPPSEAVQVATPAPPVQAPKPLIRADVAKEKPETKPRAWFAAELGPSLDIGSLPGLAPGVQVSAITGMRAVGLKLSGVMFPDRSKAASGGPGGTFTLWAASAALCGVAERQPTLVRLCAGSEFGRLSGTGENTTHSRIGSSAWLAPFAELTGSWPLMGDSVRIFGSGTAAIPLIRKAFLVEGFGTVHQPGTIVGRLGFGLELLWR
jgi:hypothetical protein